MKLWCIEILANLQPSWHPKKHVETLLQLETNLSRNKVARPKSYILKIWFTRIESYVTIAAMSSQYDYPQSDDPIIFEDI